MCCRKFHNLITMEFKRIMPCADLEDVVDCFWMITDEQAEPIEQKIIPDGFPEIIFHFGDPYQIRITKDWELQTDNLLAGQITRHFFLRNTGRSETLGIKMKPAAITRLFDISMHDVTDRVVPLKSKIQEGLPDVALLRSLRDDAERVRIIEQALKKFLHGPAPNTWIEKAVDAIFETRGLTPVARLCSIAGTGERQLERAFRKYIGLSPKFYARIIRFSHIFQLIHKKKLNGSELGLEAGFYDQSHFIKNFKAFTGEDPSRYFFDQQTLANFFLKK